MVRFAALLLSFLVSTMYAMQPGQEQERLKIPLPVFTGITNFGNTCYMNSMLQCLMRLPFLYELLVVTPQAVPSINAVDVAQDKHRLLQELCSMSRCLAIKEADISGQAAIFYQELIAQKERFFVQKRQEDIDEAIGFLLQNVMYATDVNTGAMVFYVGQQVYPLFCNSMHTEYRRTCGHGNIAHQAVQENRMRLAFSPDMRVSMRDDFYMQYRDTINKKPKKQREAYKKKLWQQYRQHQRWYDPRDLTTLSAAAVKPKPQYLESLLAYRLQPIQSITECPEQNVHGKHESMLIEHTLIHEPAPIFIVSLLRSVDGVNKITVPVIIPEVLAMQDAWLTNHARNTIDQEKRVYDLCGLILHHGVRANEGHYTAYCKEDGVWRWYNDDKVIEKDPFLSDPGIYVAFYQQRAYQRSPQAFAYIKEHYNTMRQELATLRAQIKSDNKADSIQQPIAQSSYISSWLNSVAQWLSGNKRSHEKMQKESQEEVHNGKKLPTTTTIVDLTDVDDVSQK